LSLPSYTGDLIQGGSTIIAALIAVGAGIWGFFRQKEYELVQKRYLEEGVDVIVATAVNALNTYHHNWARCLEMLKAFRDNDAMKPEELDTAGFLHLPTDRFALTANYRMNQIVDSGVIWQVFQLVISFAQYGCSVTRDEIPVALKLKLTTDKVMASRKEMVDEAMKLVEELDKKSHRFHFFIGKLQDIAMLLEEQQFALKDIRKLRGHPVVVETIKALKEHYKDDLQGA
jgi:hypothetical protein